MNYISQNLAAVRQQINEARTRASREDEVTLIAAVKYASDEELGELLSLGVADVGENRVQQLLAHYAQYEQRELRVHFIGTLQKNKIKYIIDKVYAVHSVDSIELARELERHAAKHARTLRVYVEVNVAGEQAKSGVLPDEALALCREILSLPHLQLVGLMTMGPRCDSDEEYRPYFAALRHLAREIERELALSEPLLLSMGMSQSVSAAVMEGASSVRVGRRLFAKEENTSI